MLDLLENNPPTILPKLHRQQWPRCLAKDELAVLDCRCQDISSTIAHRFHPRTDLAVSKVAEPKSCLQQPSRPKQSRQRRRDTAAWQAYTRCKAQQERSFTDCDLRRRLTSFPTRFRPHGPDRFRGVHSRIRTPTLTAARLRRRMFLLCMCMGTAHINLIVVKGDTHWTPIRQRQTGMFAQHVRLSSFWPEFRELYLALGQRQMLLNLSLVVVARTKSSKAAAGRTQVVKYSVAVLWNVLRSGKDVFLASTAVRSTALVLH